MASTSKVICRIIGIMNLALACLGVTAASMMWPTVSAQLQKHDPTIPYFQSAYFVMSGANVLFITALVVIAIRLVQIRVEAIKPYCILVLIGLIYTAIGGGLWLAKDPIGKSIASASGVGNMAISPFFAMTFFIYPILSAFTLLLMRNRLSMVRLTIPNDDWER